VSGDENFGGAPPESVIVNAGVMYLAGNRLVAPFVLGLTANFITVNGLRAPADRSLASPYVPLPGDTTRARLSREATAIARQATLRNITHDEIMRAVRDHFAADPLVAEATLASPTAIKIVWRDIPDLHYSWSLQGEIRMTDPTAEELALKRNRGIFHLLSELKARLERGELIIYSGSGTGYRAFPRTDSGTMGSLIARFQSGAKLSAQETTYLQRYLTKRDLSKLTSPATLRSGTN
jgi:hypothetical protein